MQFQVGDKVYHPIHGVGQIVTVEERQLVREKARLYYQIAADKSTVWVPVDAQETIGLRRLTERRALARYRGVLKSRPVALDNDHAKRHLEIAERLKRGSFRVVCEVVRDLSARGWRKPLTQVDLNSLQRAREELNQEWAAAAGVSATEASQEIEALLSEARQAHKA